MLDILLDRLLGHAGCFRLYNDFQTHAQTSKCVKAIDDVIPLLILNLKLGARPKTIPNCLSTRTIENKFAFWHSDRHYMA